MNKLSACAAVCFVALLALGSATAQDFNGPYVGGYAGGVKGTSEVWTFTVFSPTGYFASSSVPAIGNSGHQKITPRGINLGGTAGYNYQRRHWVFGIEGDFGWMHAKDVTDPFATYPCCSPTGFFVKQTVKTDWLFTARPRLGWASGPVMVYGTAGVAMTNLNYSEAFFDTFASAHESATISSVETGWTAGGGMEFKLNTHWSMKGEYLFADFGSGVKTTSTNLSAFTPPIPFPTNVFTHAADLNLHIWRSGLNYRF